MESEQFPFASDKKDIFIQEKIDIMKQKWEWCQSEWN